MAEIKKTLGTSRYLSGTSRNTVAELYLIYAAYAFWMMWQES
jgi:hypothetical protein